MHTYNTHTHIHTHIHPHTSAWNPTKSPKIPKIPIFFDFCQIFPHLSGILARFPLKSSYIHTYTHTYTHAFIKHTYIHTFIHRYIDFRAIQDKEKLIEEKYRQADKSNLGELKKALAAKIAAINDLESSKYQFGRPVNIEDYLMYRHCLLYKDIAKDTALINSDPSIRFYFKDDQKEADLQRKLRLENNKAKANFVSMIADDELFDAIYAQYCVNVGKPVILSSLEDRMIKENELDKFSSDEPIKFNKMFNDADIKIKAIIEILIERGEFVRSQYNQNIITPEGEFIGANVKEAVAWFKNPANADVVNAYKNKLKNV